MVTIHKASRKTTGDPIQQGLDRFYVFEDIAKYACKGIEIAEFPAPMDFDDPLFLAYMEGLFPRPRELRHQDMCDVSPEVRAKRRKHTCGHIDGIHPALIWHYEKYKKQHDGLEKK